MIKLEDLQNNKEKCPKCGNKIFLEYAGASKGDPGGMLKCTYCFTVFDFSIELNSFIERK